MRSTNLRTVAHSHIRAERKKFVLTSIAIGMAAFFLAAVFILSQSLNASFRVAAAPIYSQADYVANAPGNQFVRQEEGASTLTEKQWQAIQDSPAVEATWARSDYYYSFSTGEGEGSSSIIRLSPTPSSPDLFPYTVEGSLPSSPQQVLISSATAEGKQLKIGDSIKFDTPYSQETPLDQPLTISGIFDVPSDLSADTSLALISQEASTQLMTATEEPGTTSYSEVIVKLKDPSAGLPQDLQNVLTSGGSSTALVINTGNEQISSYVKSLMNGLDILTYMLLIFAGIALVVSTFVISNTFRVLTTLRVTELAMLRTLGARRRQLTAMLLREALSIGLIASACGVGIAYLLALAIRFFIPEGVVIGLSPVAGLIGVLVSSLVTALASLLPAMAAMKVSPLEALSNAQKIEAEPAVSLKTMVLAGLLILAGTGAFIYANLHEESGLIILAVFVLTVGILLIFPLVLWLLLRVLQVLVKGSGFMTLALSQAVHSIRRTASTGTIIFLSSTLIAAVLTGYSTGMASNQKMTETEYPVAIDAYVFKEESTQGKSVALAEIQAKEAELDAVDHVTGASIAAPAGDMVQDDGSSPGTTAAVYAVDPAALEKAVPGLTEKLTDDTVILPSSYDKALDGKEVTIKAGDQSVRVRAQVSDLNLYMPLMTYQKAEPLLATGAKVAENYDYAALIDVATGVSSTEAQTVLDTVQNITGSTATAGGLIDRLRNEQMMRIFVTVVLGLLSVATLIALLGIANTLSLVAYQRRRENSMLRSIGMSAQKLTSLVALESVIVAILSLVCGVVVGIGLAVMAVQMLAVEGLEMIYSVPPFGMLVLAVLGIVLAYLFSLFPARRASRVSPVEALRLS